MEDTNTNPPVIPAHEPESTEPATVPLDELSQARAQALENLSGWKRAMADYANLKKDSERAQREVSAYAIGSFIERLLPVVEGFRQATAHRPVKEGEPLDEKRITQWVDGIGHVRTQLDQVLATAGVTPIVEENVPFDPNLRVLKPARVVVSE